MKKYPIFINKNYEEDPDVCLTEDKIIKSRRNYLFRIKKGDPVVFILSGGIDSSVALGKILKELNSPVYPLYIENFYPKDYRRPYLLNNKCPFNLYRSI